jgi:hypothetical protein
VGRCRLPGHHVGPVLLVRIESAVHGTSIAVPSGAVDGQQDHLRVDHSTTQAGDGVGKQEKS